MSPQRDETLDLDRGVKLSWGNIGKIIGVAFFAGLMWFKMDAIQRDVRKQWSIPQQVIWADRLAAKNPSMTIPSVDDVVKTINAQN